MLLAISSFLIVLFILGPLALTSGTSLGPGWLPSLAYFACLGGAFMLIEVALLQRFVLLLELTDARLELAARDVNPLGALQLAPQLKVLLADMGFER